LEERISARRSSTKLRIGHNSLGIVDGGTSTTRRLCPQMASIALSAPQQQQRRPRQQRPLRHLHPRLKSLRRQAKAKASAEEAKARASAEEAKARARVKEARKARARARAKAKDEASI